MMREDSKELELKSISLREKNGQERGKQRKWQQGPHEKRVYEKTEKKTIQNRKKEVDK